MRIAFWLLRRFEIFRLPEQQNTEIRAEVDSLYEVVYGVWGEHHA
jgi:hypothetical protein